MATAKLTVPILLEWKDIEAYMAQHDIVEVVRCKDCFYAIPYNEKWTLPKKNNCLWCKRYEDVRTQEWYCADGERRSSAEIESDQ